MFPVLAIAAFIVVVALLAYYSHQQRQRRLDELAALAREINWLFIPPKECGYDSRYAQFAVFCRGSGRYAYNTLTGSVRVGDESWPARMGDYHYQTTSSDGKTTHTHHHHFSYLLVQLPYPTLPDLRIRREGFFDALANVFGFDDIDFESAEFSRRFHVKSADKKFAYNVICPAMMEFLLAVEPPTVEIDRGYCCLTGRGTWSAAEFRHRLDWTSEFFALWPQHLVADLKSR